MEEQQHKGGNIKARIEHLQAQLEYVVKILKGGKHKAQGGGEQERCPRCTYERHEAGQRCPAEERGCNTCGDPLP